MFTDASRFNFAAIERGILKPAAQQAAAHSSDGLVKCREECCILTGEQSLNQLQVAQRDRIQHHALGAVIVGRPIEMFERLFAGMPEAERRALHAKAVLRSCRLKLAFACLVARDPAGSIAVTAEMIPRPLGTILRGVLRVVPPAPVRAIGGRAWRLRQRLGFYRIETPAVV